MRQPIRATRDRAAALARLTEQARAQGLTSSERGQSPALCVKILTAIRAGDYRQKDAMLMRLDGSTLVETGQTVKVRHVGEAAIAANTIVTPEPCGTLGLCFTNHAEIVREAVRLYRPARIVGPQAAAGSPVADYTASWGFGPWYHPPNLYAKSGYFADVDFSTLPDGYDSARQAYYWIKKMVPMRYALHAYNGQFSPFLYGGGRPSGYGTAAPLQIASTSVIGVTGHLSPFLARGVSIVYNWDTLGVSEAVNLPGNRPVETATQPLPVTGRTMNAWAYQNYKRIWVDGVDVTGIVGTSSNGGAGATFLSDPQEFIGKTLEIDVWWRLAVYLSAKGKVNEVVPSNGTLQAVRQILLLPSEECTGVIEATQYGGPDLQQQWNLAFDINGPFSATSLVMGPAPTSGWAWQVYGNATRMTRTSGGILAILDFDWRESDRPMITYTRQDATNPFGSYGIWRYRPADTATFSGLVTPSSYNVKKGIWNPDASTVFELFHGKTPYGNGYRYAGDLEPDDLDFSAVPQTITVSKVT